MLKSQLVALITVKKSQIPNEEQNTLTTRFYWKDLLKITSKIQNAKILIFYFGLTNCPQQKTNPASPEELIQCPGKTGIKDFPHKKQKYKKIEIMYEFETVDHAKECIGCVKEVYKKFKSSVYASSRPKHT